MASGSFAGTHRRRLQRLSWPDLPGGTFVLLDTSPAIVIVTN
jgi:hypothetical protein